MSLGNSILKASGWVLGGQAMMRVIRLLATAVLARLLSPTDYGLFVLVAVVRELIQVFFNTGTAEYLMRRPAIDYRLYDTAWTLGIMRGVLTATVITLASPALARFLEEPRLVGILWLTAATVLVNGFTNTGMAIWRRQMKYRPSTIMNVSADVGSLVVTLVLAFWLRNYWALAWGAFASGVLTVAASYWLHPYRPKLGVHGLRDMFGFGVWISLANLIFAFASRIDAFVLQKLIAPAAVGLFATARDFSALPVQQLVTRTSGVFSSALAVVEERGQRRRIYLELIAVYITLLWPVLVGTALVADDAAWLIFGPRWEGIDRIIAAISLMMAVQLLAANATPVITMAGRSRLLTLRAAIYIVVRLPAFFFGARYGGLDGAVLGYCASGVFLTAIDLTLLRSLVTVRLRDYLRVMVRPGLATAAMAAAVLLVRQFLPTTDAEGEIRVLRLAVEVGVGAAAYAAAAWTAWTLAGRPAGPERRVVNAATLGFKAVRGRVLGWVGR